MYTHTENQATAVAVTRTSRARRKVQEGGSYRLRPGDKAGDVFYTLQSSDMRNQSCVMLLMDARSVCGTPCNLSIARSLCANKTRH